MVFYPMVFYWSNGFHCFPWLRKTIDEWINLKNNFPTFVDPEGGFIHPRTPMLLMILVVCPVRHIPNLVDSEPPQIDIYLNHLGVTGEL